jgi:hypothetical protein
MVSVGRFARWKLTAEARSLSFKFFLDALFFDLGSLVSPKPYFDRRKKVSRHVFVVFEPFASFVTLRETFSSASRSTR